MQVDPNAPPVVTGPVPSPTVSGAIKQAAKATGANFQYLLATAQVESNYNPNAQGATSSAKGLFQFIEQTWLATLKDAGPAHGYGKYSDAIGRTAEGQYVVTDPKLASKIMNLRADPTANSVMAGAFTKNNAAKLGERLGRNPTEGELYIAHFLGPAGASRMINMAESRPNTRAADVFPSAAQANPTIFYNRQGGARSVADVYQMLIGRYANARSSPANKALAPVAVAATQTKPAPQAPVQAPAATQPKSVSQLAAVQTQVPPPAVAQATAFAPETSQLSAAYAQAMRPTPVAVERPENRPVFHSLFSVSGRDTPVAPIVSSLWGSPPTQPPEARPAKPTVLPEAPMLASAENQPQQPPKPVPVEAPQPQQSSGGALDLFQEGLPDARALFRGRV
jgi:hypothetical protein